MLLSELKFIFKREHVNFAKAIIEYFLQNKEYKKQLEIDFVANFGIKCTKVILFVEFGTRTRDEWYLQTYEFFQKLLTKLSSQ